MKLFDKLKGLASSNKEEKYYNKLFVKNDEWNKPTPNEDENLRWKEIEKFIVSNKPAVTGRPLSILDVGAGRGWLTNLLSGYGHAEGLEPVKPVAQYAEKLFPGLVIHNISFFDFNPGVRYDLIVTSEVIEHIADHEKVGFAEKLASLLPVGGILILTTPRKEILAEMPQKPGQPVEEWMTEDEVRNLFVKNGFAEAGKVRIKMPIGDHVKEVYQVWCFRKD